MASGGLTLGLRRISGALLTYSVTTHFRLLCCAEPLGPLMEEGILSGCGSRVSLYSDSRDLSLSTE